MILKYYNSLIKKAMFNSSSEISHIISIYSKQQKPPTDKGNLYLSGVYCMKPKTLNELKINCVLSIIDKWSYEQYKVTQKMDQSQIKNHKWIDIQDDESIKIYPFLDEAHSYIKSMLANHNVLVHCQMGMSRSSSLVIAFLMKQYGMDYHQARVFTKNKRRIVQPNEGFQKDLLKFQEYLRTNHPDIFQNK